MIKQPPRKERWMWQGQILEKYLLKNRAALDSHSARRSFHYLISCFVAGGQWTKIMRYGFRYKEGFESMVGLPIRSFESRRRPLTS
jgi:hypothetical protein